MADVPVTKPSVPSVDVAAPVTPTPKEPEKSETEKKADEVLAKAQEILKKHGGQESNIGIGNEYWSLMTTFRQLMQEVQLEKSFPSESSVKAPTK